MKLSEIATTLNKTKSTVTQHAIAISPDFGDFPFSDDYGFNELYNEIQPITGQFKQAIDACIDFGRDGHETAFKAIDNDLYQIRALALDIIDILKATKSLQTDGVKFNLLRCYFSFCNNIRLLYDFIGYPISEQKTEATNPEGLKLPPELDTDRAKKYFARAIEVGYMKPTDTGYKWEFCDKRGAKARLAYFVERVYCPTATDKIQSDIIRLLQQLFGVERLDRAIQQNADTGKSKAVKEWRANIDTKIFYD